MPVLWIDSFLIFLAETNFHEINQNLQNFLNSHSNSLKVYNRFILNLIVSYCFLASKTYVRLFEKFIALNLGIFQLVKVSFTNVSAFIKVCINILYIYIYTVYIYIYTHTYIYRISLCFNWFVRYLFIIRIEMLLFKY